MICIYDDRHYNNAHVLDAVQSVTNVKAVFCTAKMIMDGCLDNAQLLIIPGGADLYYCEKLNGLGNKKIRDFIHSGGSYLGICAGAYYACASLDWGCGEISGDRELALYNGKATGPIYDWVENCDSLYEGSWIKAVQIKTDSGLFLTQYNGGCVFDGETCDILAQYTELKNLPPAIISGQFGQGRYILSSPHIEKFGHLLTDGLYKHQNNSYQWEAAEIDKLLDHEQVQKDFFKSIIDRLL